jgi:hypothetical protein
MGYVRAQLAFGPRIPGSPGHRRTGDWIVGRLRGTADAVVEQTWTHVTAQGDTLPLRNIFARFRPGLADRVLYISHWDTRPMSDAANVPPERRTVPVPGANDGASSTALLLALADVLKRTPPTVGVDLLFTDGEDYGASFNPPYRDVLLGSQYFVRHPPVANYRPLYGVLWDMISQPNLQIYQEPNSVQGAPEVVSRVWSTAAGLGYADVFIPQVGRHPITDDHTPFLDVGMHVIDVIDYEYPYHHTPEDTYDKVSKQSMQIVGDVALALVSGRE